MTRRRWLFGDQLGPHFLDDDSQQVLLVESRRVFARRRFHRQKAHLVLSAMRHRAAELGDRCTYVRSGTYREALAGVDGPLDVVQPTSWAALHLVNALCEERDIARLPARGYATSRADFAAWAAGRARRRLLMEDFYRDSRRRLGLLMEGPEPEGGRWNFDADNREPPPRGQDTLGVPEPRWPVEDEIDAQVRERPGPVGGRGGGHGRRGRATPVRRHPGRGAGRPGRLRRAPAPRLRPPRGRRSWAATAGWRTRCCRRR